MSKFIHLHNHSHYSVLDALTTPEELVIAAKADDQTAIALTDHGVLFGLMEFQKVANKHNVKPIFGMEAYIAEGSRFNKVQTDKLKQHKNYYHLILLAKDLIGYKNLVKLTSYAHTEGFYYRPRIDKELLEKHKDGLIATSACLGGVVSSHLVSGNYTRALNEAKYYQDLFGDDFYLELQNHNYEEDKIILRDVPKISQELGIKLIATNDIHYLKKEHAVPHNVYLLIKDTSAANADKVDIYDLRYKTDEFYFKTQNQMSELFADFPEALTNTLEIADKCDLKIKFPIHMPEYKIPQESKSKNLDEHLEELVWKGIREKYDVITDEIKERVEFELTTIKNMGFSDYFLVVYDLIKAAKDRGIRVGPGRGSAAGSIVSYALNITAVDPLEGNLLFERFLNPERVSMPDIDIDFNDERRNEMIQYCQEKYGVNSVAQIITFGKMSSRMVLKDVGRVMGIPLSEINRITAKIPSIFGKVLKLKDALNLADLKYLKETPDPKIKQFLELCSVLEDKNRSIGTHAAGVVITPGDVTDFVPVFQNSKTTDDNIAIATQYTMNFIEDAGVIKMDFLGLRTLSIIDRTLELIKLNQNIDLDIDKIDKFDTKTYELISEGKTIGVFQFESGGMQDYLKKLKPHSLEELTAMNALYRPGPMASIPDYIERKHGRQKTNYLHPIMEPVLKNTYGIIVYQEQVMQLVQTVGNFTLGEADILRRAMGKKLRSEVDRMKPKFIQGAEANGVPGNLAIEIFELIDKFADYGFNKSHSYVYSWIAYQTAYLKAHFPAEFLAANMTAELNNQSKIVELIDEAKTFNITIAPPDINTSIASFTVKNNTIYFGLAAVKGIGINPVEHIVEVRKEKPFESFYDFVKRTDPKYINRRVLESLIFAGAFDQIANGQRRALYEAIDDALNFARAQSKNENMIDLFAINAETKSATEPKLPIVTEWSEKERLQHEKEVLNFYVTGHPLNEFESIVKSFSNSNIFRYLNKDEDINDNDLPKIEKVRFCGLISSVRTRRDKSNRLIGFVIVEDFIGKVECIFWSEAFAQFENLLIEDNPITIEGKLDYNDSTQLKIVVENAYSFQETVSKNSKGLIIYLDVLLCTENDIQQIYELIIKKNGYGKSSDIVFILNDGTIKREYITFEQSVNYDLNIIKQLQSLKCVKLIRFIPEN
jgi:DNA polymerase-3 subunit alpha